MPTRPTRALSTLAVGVAALLAASEARAAAILLQEGPLSALEIHQDPAGVGRGGADADEAPRDGSREPFRESLWTIPNDDRFERVAADEATPASDPPALRGALEACPAPGGLEPASLTFAAGAVATAALSGRRR